MLLDTELSARDCWALILENDAQINVNLAMAEAEQDAIEENTALIESEGRRVFRNWRLTRVSRRSQAAICLLLQANDLMEAENSELLALMQRIWRAELH